MLVVVAMAEYHFTERSSFHVAGPMGAMGAVGAQSLWLRTGISALSVRIAMLGFDGQKMVSREGGISGEEGAPWICDWRSP